MTPRSWTRIGSFAGLLAVLPVWVGHGAEKRRPSPLADVKALEAPVTITEAKIPLGELVQRVATETGVALVAVKDVADEPVSVVVKAMASRRLLDELAELLDYQWSRRGKEGAWRYEIWQDLASKQREAALREALIRDAEKRFREELNRHAEVAALPDEAFQRLLAEAEKYGSEWQEKTPEERNALVSTEAGKARQGRLTAAMALRSPIARSLAQLLRPLSARQWERMKERHILTFSSVPDAGQERLPMASERRLRAARPSHLAPGSRLAFPDPVGEEKIRNRDQSLQEAWSAATGYRVTVMLDTDRLATSGTLRLNAYAMPFRTGTPLDADLPPMGGLSGVEFTLLGGARDPSLSLELDTAQRRAALAKDPVVGSARPFKPEAKPNAGSNGPLAPGDWRLADLMPDLARTFSVQFIADAYWTRGVGLTTAQIPATPVTLFRLLDDASLRSHQWDRHNNLIRLRSQTWYLDRPREIPLRHVRRWMVAVEKHGALPLAEYETMVTELTDLQLETLGLLDDALALPPDLGMVHGSRHGLRLLFALLPEQRQRLWDGGTIPASQLGRTQRQRLETCVKEVARVPSDEIDPQQLGAGFLSLTRKAQVRLIRRQGGRGQFQEQDTGQPIASSGADGAPLPGTRVARHPVARVQFWVQYGANAYEGFYLILAAAS